MSDITKLTGDQITAAQAALHTLQDSTKSAELASLAATDAKAKSDAAETARVAASQQAVASVQAILDAAGADEIVIFQGNVVSITGGVVTLTPAVILQ